MTESYSKETDLMKLGKALFTTNVLEHDFTDVQVSEVTGCDFPQQPGGGGYRISFSVSHHAIGKTDGQGHAALARLCPNAGD